MSRSDPFIPGRLAAAKGPLAPYRPQQPVGAALGYITALTAPGDLVVDLFCHGPRFVREAVEAGRRVFGFSINPLLLLAARLGLLSSSPENLNMAFTHLVDSLKGDIPLRSHLASLYRTACPVCGTSGLAEWFAWRRDLDYPFGKMVRCSQCGKAQAGATDKDDVRLARSIAPRGLAYYYALDRAAPPDHPARDRAAELVDCYTPRNLSALMDLARRLEATELDESAEVVLMAGLLDCFDRGSKLYPYGEDRARPQTLRIPSRYLERNVWLCFEESFSRLLADSASFSVPEAEDPKSLLRGEEDGYALVASGARDTGDILPAEKVDLVLVDPPRPDGVFWALSALWAAWLSDSPASHAMRPLLRRRRFDWEWHWRALRDALAVVGRQITKEGFLVTLFSAGEPALFESVCLAVASAGYELIGWGYAAEVGYRLLWQWGRSRSALAIDVETLKRKLVVGAKEAIVGALCDRGEPTPMSLLHAGSYAFFAREKLLDSVAVLSDPASRIGFTAEIVDQSFRKAPVIRLNEEGEALWWLVDPQSVTDPLADRVEATVRRLLIEHASWNGDDLVNEIYGCFSGALTPDLTFVHVCVASYGRHQDGQIRLRAEDDPQRRSMDIESLCQGLSALGERLGFEVADGERWDVRWLEEGEEIYVFAVSSTGSLAPYLLSGESRTEDVQRCLVVPGGRAQLIDLKMRRDPRLVRAAESGAWQFIKFRHLRRLMAEDELDRRAFDAVLGLDPIKEREGAQMPLF